MAPDSDVYRVRVAGIDWILDSTPARCSDCVVSEHWDPAWKRPTFIFNKPFDPAEALAELKAGRDAGLRRPEGDHAPCRRDDGLLRHATIGPDYTLLVAGDDRARAAELQRQIGRLTLYFIATRPRIRAVPGECGLVDGSFRLVFEAQLDDGSTDRFKVTQPVPKGVEVGPIEYEGGGAVLVRTTPDDEVVRQRAGLLAQGLLAPPKEAYAPSVFDLDLRYIGRARGRIRETCALDRLKTHAQYQHVLEEIMASEHRNREVWMILATGTTVDMVAGHDDPEVTEAEVVKGTDQARAMLSEDDRIDLAEALLINHFKPPLNDQLTGDLDTRTGLMSRWRRAQVTGVTLAFSTHDLRLALKTDAVPATYFHGKTICL
jgi:hypothetical protein